MLFTAYLLCLSLQRVNFVSVKWPFLGTKCEFARLHRQLRVAAEVDAAVDAVVISSAYCVDLLSKCGFIDAALGRV